ncbi:MAG: ABC transporter ATP-binding protein [Desulforudis sp.]|nr:ABC transporter ATP-binding protein [Clostridia bacterium]RJX17757.1 MAG: ABC transporter ATP-binding protein [Desulforudis sp.]
MIKVKSLSVIYRGTNAVVPAIRDISFAMERGSTCAVIGPSGCGKTTMLYVLAGLRPDFEGQVEVAEAPVRPKRRETALILQDYGLLPWKTVRQNVVLGLELRGVGKSERLSRCEGIMNDLGLLAVKNLYPSQLSGGQRQRVAIARAMAVQPDLLLMDEPFSSLDALTRENLQDNLLEIWSGRQMTVLIVTHNIEEAVFLGQKIIVLSPRPAGVLAEVENNGVGTPGWRSSQEFFRVCTRLRGMLVKEERQLCAARAGQGS